MGTATNYSYETDSISKLGMVLAGIAVLAAVVIAISLWGISGSLNKQACVDKAVGKYPAVPVSAFVGKDTGALKLSFVTERQKELNSCG